MLKTPTLPGTPARPFTVAELQLRGLVLISSVRSQQRVY